MRQGNVIVPANVSTIRLAGAVAAMVLTLTLALAVHPMRLTVCPLREWAGLPCPLCGMTRSLMSVWRGDLLESVRHHPLGIPLFALCVLLVAGSLAANRSGGPLEAAHNTAMWIAGGKALAFGGLLLGTVWILRIVLWKVAPAMVSW